MVNTIKNYLHNTRLIFETGFRHVCQQTAECDRRQQQWFEAFTNSKVQQNDANKHHDSITHGESGETAVIPYGL